MIAERREAKTIINNARSVRIFFHSHIFSVFSRGNGLIKRRNNLYWLLIASKVKSVIYILVWLIITPKQDEKVNEKFKFISKNGQIFERQLSSFLIILRLFVITNHLNLFRREEPCLLKSIISWRHYFTSHPCHLRCHVCKEGPCLRWHRVCREEPCHQLYHVCRGGLCHQRCHVCSFHHLHMTQVSKARREQDQAGNSFDKYYYIMKMDSYDEWCPNHVCCFAYRSWETTDVSLSRRFALYHDSWHQWAVRWGELLAVWEGGKLRRGELKCTLRSWSWGVWSVMQPDTATSQTRRNTSWFIYGSLRWLLSSKIWSKDCELDNSLQSSLWSVENVQLSMCSSMQVLQNTIIRFSPSPLIM